MAYMVDVLVSLGLSDASKGMPSNISRGLRASEDVEIKSEEQVAKVVGSMFDNLLNGENRPLLLKRIRELPTFLLRNPFRGCQLPPLVPGFPRWNSIKGSQGPFYQCSTEGRRV